MRTTTGRGRTALAGFLLVTFALAACETDDGPIATAPDIEACLDDEVPLPRVMRSCQGVLDSETVSVAERATALTRIGYGHLSQGENREAQAAFQKALDQMPSLAGAHLGLGWANLRLRDLEAARLAFDTALSLDPNLYSANEGRGIVHLVNQDFASAIADFDRVLAASPRSARALRNRGDAHFALGQHRQALADYDAVIAMVEVAQPELFLARSRTLVAMGRQSDPVADWAAALNANGPEQIGAWQKRMQGHGLYAGPVDGEPSPATRNALAACIGDKACRRVN